MERYQMYFPQKDEPSDWSALLEPYGESIQIQYAKPFGKATVFADPEVIPMIREVYPEIIIERMMRR